MKKNNLLVSISVKTIEYIWQENLGKKYNKKRNIICRFYPSCSNYGIMALEKDGFLKGWAKTINRIWRCKPNNHDSCVDYP
ncbi:MAG: membrane protein insertion efficiency factor YidD [Nanoarchaeota archaeon]|nr:membrane protein insertion efficiency factor YidD [Nanoarchaeota archaeon]